MLFGFTKVLLGFVRFSYYVVCKVLVSFYMFSYSCKSREGGPPLWFITVYQGPLQPVKWPIALCEAVRRLMNNFKVDGLTRALTRQLYILYFLVFSLGFIGFLSFSQFCLGFPINPGISYQPFLGATRGAKCPIWTEPGRLPHESLCWPTTPYQAIRKPDRVLNDQCGTVDGRKNSTLIRPFKGIK